MNEYFHGIDLVRVAKPVSVVGAMGTKVCRMSRLCEYQQVLKY